MLELVGSNANVQLGRLDNHLGNDETIRWVADANGVTPITISAPAASSACNCRIPWKSPGTRGRTAPAI